MVGREERPNQQQFQPLDFKAFPVEFKDGCKQHTAFSSHRERCLTMNRLLMTMSSSLSSCAHVHIHTHIYTQKHSLKSPCLPTKMSQIHTHIKNIHMYTIHIPSHTCHTYLNELTIMHTYLHTHECKECGAYHPIHVHACAMQHTYFIQPHTHMCNIHVHTCT